MDAARGFMVLTASRALVDSQIHAMDEDVAMMVSVGTGSACVIISIKDLHVISALNLTNMAMTVRKSAGVCMESVTIVRGAAEFVKGAAVRRVTLENFATSFLHHVHL
ncbi:unnamed protein product [Ranitomeya imitator]|uniref:Uncharacterized protein n=1 Tax=Ranitomeya imitator TaxID=111125 RepID=A0ABN9L5N9_9NEOB|nr:unnamed protein product [Ranitomeya imitator]